MLNDGFMMGSLPVVQGCMRKHGTSGNQFDPFFHTWLASCFLLLVVLQLFEIINLPQIWNLEG